MTDAISETVEHPFGTLKTRMGATHSPNEASAQGCHRDGTPRYTAKTHSGRSATYSITSSAWPRTCWLWVTSMYGVVSALCPLSPSSKAAAAVADRRGSLGPQADSRCGNVPDAIDAIACNIAGLGVFGPSVEGLTLISPLHHAVVAFHGGPVA